MSQPEETPTEMAREDRCIDSAVMLTLLDNDSQRPWSVAEVVQEMGSPEVSTIDSLSRLHRAGLVHRIGDFVFATRPAQACEKLEL